MTATPQAQVSEEGSSDVAGSEQGNLGLKIGWVCFHCWEHFPPTFAGQRDAQAHFGGAELREPACLISKKDHGLLLHVRALELERDKLQQQLSTLSAPPARQVEDVDLRVPATVDYLNEHGCIPVNAEKWKSLIEALRPFARVAKYADDDNAQRIFGRADFAGNDWREITVGDLRRAARAFGALESALARPDGERG